MDREEIFSIQRKFSKFHRVFLSIIILYCISFIMKYPSDIFYWYGVILISFFLVTEYLLLKTNDINIFEISFVRYLQVFIMSFQLVRTDELVTFGVILMCLILFIAEFYLSLDFTESFYRIIFYTALIITLSMVGLFKSLLKAEIDDKLFGNIIIIGMLLLMSVCAAKMVSKYIENNVKVILSQARMIEDVNETNDDLLRHQEKVKRSNELLGIQKLKLEKAYNEINRANSEMKIQDEIVKYITSSLEIGNLMTLITESVINQIGADVCTIVLYPGTVGNDYIKYKIRTKLGKKYENNLSQFMEEKCFEEYLEGNKVYLDNHVKDFVYSFNRDGVLGSFIIVPLVKKDKKLGALFVGHTKYHYFTNHTSFYEVIVAQFIIALNNANMYRKMERMAITDGLTGIYNRRYLTEMFNQLINDSLVSKTPLTVALFDIDKFKRINDTYGHLFGDVVIKTISKLAYEAAVANNGFVGRYGGEEFVIIFPNKGLRESYQAVQVLHYRIKKEEINCNGEIIHVSVSLGLTCYPETCRNPSELLNRADWAMYYAKENGRDLIIIDRNEIKESMLC